MQWRRPESVAVGQVWLRFKGKHREGAAAQIYQIRDMEESRRKECLDFMEDVFLRDEPLSELLDIKSDQVSVSTIRSNWEALVSQRVSLACYTEVDGSPDELVAFNNLLVRSQDDEEDAGEVQGAKWRILLQTLTDTENLVNIFDHYNVEIYLSDSGLAVSPRHRGQNIGARMLEAREPLCRALNIRAISTVFTAQSSMALARKCGYELLGTLPYSEMNKYGYDLSNCSTNFSELRGKKL